MTVKKIVEKSQKTTFGGVEGLHIRAIQDTTSLVMMGRKTALLATLRSLWRPNRARCSAVTCNSLNALVAARSCPLRGNESYRWLEGMQTRATVLNAAMHVTVIADREGDIFEMFTCRPASGHRLLAGRIVTRRILCCGEIRPAGAGSGAKVYTECGG